MSAGRVALLVDAISEAYDNSAWRPTAGITFCNLAVQYVANKFGYDGFQNMVANQMIEVMRRGNEWRSLALENTQSIANDGELVILGREDQPHGHVVVVRPGNVVYSAKWKKHCPKVMNIGFENSIAKGVNWVFRREPEAFLYVN